MPTRAQERILARCLAFLAGLLFAFTTYLLRYLCIGLYCDQSCRMPVFAHFDGKIDAL
jgi:hypothetical protein